MYILGFFFFYWELSLEGPQFEFGEMKTTDWKLAVLFFFMFAVIYPSFYDRSIVYV